MSLISIKIKYSESNEFAGGEVLTVAELDAKAAATLAGQGFIYDKTAYTATSAAGHQYAARWHICKDVPTFAAHIRSRALTDPEAAELLAYL